MIWVFTIDSVFSLIWLANNICCVSSCFESSLIWVNGIDSVIWLLGIKWDLSIIWSVEILDMLSLNCILEICSVFSLIVFDILSIFSVIWVFET